MVNGTLLVVGFFAVAIRLLVGAAPAPFWFGDYYDDSSSEEDVKKVYVFVNYTGNPTVAQPQQLTPGQMAEMPQGNQFSIPVPVILQVSAVPPPPPAAAATNGGSPAGEAATPSPPAATTVAAATTTAAPAAR